MRKKKAREQCFPLSQPPIDEDLCDVLFGCDWEFGRGWMRAAQCHGYRSTRPGEYRHFGGNSYGVWVTCSDTIEVDSQVPSVPFWGERSQIEDAVRWSTTIPCFLHPHSTAYFLFWIQPVATVDEERLRQLKSDHARPENAGGRVANYCQDSFRLHVFPTGIPQSQEAASMANPEVPKCR